MTARGLPALGKTYQPGERWPPEACHLREGRNGEARAAWVKQPMAINPGGLHVARGVEPGGRTAKA
eukprot:6076495-Alexandrium_andersonii.AAC.1